MAPTTAADIGLDALNISVCIFCLPEQCLCAFKGYNVLNIAIGLVMSLIPGGQRETLRSESGTRRDGKVADVPPKSARGLQTHQEKSPLTSIQNPK